MIGLLRSASPSRTSRVPRTGSARSGPRGKERGAKGERALDEARDGLARQATADGLPFFPVPVILSHARRLEAGGFAGLSRSMVLVALGAIVLASCGGGAGGGPVDDLPATRDAAADGAGSSGGDAGSGADAVPGGYYNPTRPNRTGIDRRAVLSHI